MATIEVTPTTRESFDDLVNELIPSLNELNILDPSGDTRMQWDQSNPGQVADARKKFEEMKAKGYVGHRVDASGAMSGAMTDFDPTAERIIMHSRHVGG